MLARICMHDLHGYMRMRISGDTRAASRGSRPYVACSAAHCCTSRPAGVLSSVVIAIIPTSDCNSLPSTRPCPACTLRGQRRTKQDRLWLQRRFPHNCLAAVSKRGGRSRRRKTPSFLRFLHAHVFALHCTACPPLLSPRRPRSSEGELQQAQAKSMHPCMLLLYLTE